MPHYGPDGEVPTRGAIAGASLALLVAVAPQVPAQEVPVHREPRTRAAEVLARRDHRWIRRSTVHADVYVLVGSRAASLAPGLSTAVQRAIDADLALLGEPFAGPRLQLFIVGTAADMTPLIGGPALGRAITREGTAFLVGNDSMPPALRHEIMHLLSWRLWGPPAAPWLAEGLATLAAGGCAGYTASAIAATLDREGRLVPLATLWNDFDVAWETGAIYYMQAASVVEHIDRRYGRARLRAVWSGGGSGDLESRLGVDRRTLERDWRADLARRRPSASWSILFGKMVSRGCE